MSRPRKPTVLHMLKGTNPSRMRRQQRDKEPETAGPLPPNAPEWMSEHQQDCYLEVIAKMHKDVLSCADGPIVELIACLISEMRLNHGDLSGNKMGRLLSGLERLGMTPSSRSKVQAMPREDKTENPLDEFAA